MEEGVGGHVYSASPVCQVPLDGLSSAAYVWCEHVCAVTVTETGSVGTDSGARLLAESPSGTTCRLRDLAPGKRPVPQFPRL